MKFRVLKPLSSLHDERLYKPGEIYDDHGRLTPYQVELIVAMGVAEPLVSAPQGENPVAEKEKGK